MLLYPKIEADLASKICLLTRMWLWKGPVQYVTLIRHLCHELNLLLFNAEFVCSLQKALQYGYKTVRVRVQGLGPGRMVSTV
jgi:hypothetical protein